MAKHQNNSGQVGAIYNALTLGTKITGKIEAEGDFRLDGEVEGTIICKGKLVLGQKGFVNGEIFCENAEISGEIKGNITINDTLSLHSTALISGDITTKILVIEPNAIFNGTCSMTSNKTE